MWIIVATVLLLYLMGFLFICFLNAEESHGNPSTSDNNSSHVSPRPSSTARIFGRLFSSNLHRRCEQPEQSHSAQSPSAQTSSTPSRCLFAYRDQQLRQIQHEINEMSYLLEASQSGQGTSSVAVPVPISIPPISNRMIRVQPLPMISNNRCTFIHQLIPPQAMMVGSNGSISNAGNGTSVVIPYSTYGGGSSLSPSQSLSYSPGSSESCHIIRERQRRLRHIRMELEGLSLQLTHPNHEGTTINLENTSGDSSPLIYFGNNATANIITRSGNGSSWTVADNEDVKDYAGADDDLPGYESIACILNNSTRSTPLAGGFYPTAAENEETPPPSYSDLYSFCEWREEKRKK